MTRAVLFASVDRGKTSINLSPMNWQDLETFSFGDGPGLANRLLGAGGLARCAPDALRHHATSLDHHIGAAGMVSAPPVPPSAEEVVIFLVALYDGGYWSVSLLGDSERLGPASRRDSRASCVPRCGQQAQRPRDHYRQILKRFPNDPVAKAMLHDLLLRGRGFNFLDGVGTIL